MLHQEHFWKHRKMDKHGNVARYADSDSNQNDTEGNAAVRSERACVAQSDGMSRVVGKSEFSDLWERSLKCVCRALKTGNDRKKE